MFQNLLNLSCGVCEEEEALVQTRAERRGMNGCSHDLYEVCALVSVEIVRSSQQKTTAHGEHALVEFEPVTAAPPLG